MFSGGFSLSAPYPNETVVSSSSATPFFLLSIMSMIQPVGSWWPLLWHLCRSFSVGTTTGTCRPLNDCLGDYLPLHYLSSALPQHPIITIHSGHLIQWQKLDSAILFHHHHPHVLIHRIRWLHIQKNYLGRHLKTLTSTIIPTVAANSYFTETFLATGFSITNSSTFHCVCVVIFTPTGKHLKVCKRCATKLPCNLGTDAFSFWQLDSCEYSCYNL